MNICCIIRRFIKEEGGMNKEKKASKAFIILKISNIKVNVSLHMSSRKLMSLLTTLRQFIEILNAFKL